MTENNQQTDRGLADIESGSGKPKMSKSGKWLLTILIAAVCLTVLTVYWPALSAKALCFDDNRYFVENPLVRDPSWSSAWRFLSEVFNPSTVGGYYQPLTMISLMLDYSLVGPTDDISQFHRTSVALHVANTGLIIFLLYLIFGRAWIAAAVGLLFGVHPLTVEPIPWVGERKTLLAAFFVLWALVFFVRYVRSRERRLLIWSLAMYVLALMSKPTSTPLPVLMLLMDYWPLRRLKLATVLEKVPFFVVGGISGVITYISQARTASVITPESYGAMRVPLVICHNIIFYPFKMLWPTNLTPHNPFPSPLDLSQPEILIGVIGTGILLVAILISLRWTRAAVTGWLMFFIMALPTMQALQFSDVIMSDKFVYLPSLGILMVLAALLVWISGPKLQTGGLTTRQVVMAIIVIALANSEAIGTRKYLACWRDSVSLWQHMVEVYPKATSPRNNYGTTMGEMGEYDKAMEQFEIVLQIDPNDNTAYYNIGNVYDHRGNHEEARKYYEKALQIAPTDSDAINALGVLLINEGKLEEAADLYRRGIKIKPEMSFMMYKGLGCVMLQMGRVDEAIKELGTAVQLKADSVAYCNLGIAVASKGDMEKAMECYRKAILMDPNNAEAYYNNGNLYLAKGWPKEAAVKYMSAIKSRPNYVKAIANLAVTYAQLGQIDKTIENFRRVVVLDPNNPDSYYNLANALENKGQTDEAIENLQKAIKIAPEDLSARNNLAKLLLQKGQTEQATTEYEQVLKADPNNADAKTGLEKARTVQMGTNQQKQ